jgi:hypothetical protein
MKLYGIEYSWRDGMYVLEVPAESASEAIERVRTAANHGRCFTPTGIDARIPAWPGAGLLVRLWTWIKNCALQGGPDQRPGIGQDREQG